MSHNETDSWQQLPSFPYYGFSNTAGGTCVVAMDNYCLYVIGGARYNGRDLNRHLLFKPTANSVRFDAIKHEWERTAACDRLETARAMWQHVGRFLLLVVIPPLILIHRNV